MLFQHIERSGGNPDSVGSRHISRVEHGIVMNDYNPVTARVHVELHRLRSELDRPFERLDAVFRCRVMGAAVGDSEWQETGRGQRSSVGGAVQGPNL